MEDKFSRRVLVSITTSPYSDWKKKIKEIRKYNLTEISFFPTFLKKSERKVAYGLLKEQAIKNIPHVHARDDMEEWELEQFIQKFNTQVFNTHPGKNYTGLIERIRKYSDKVFIENLYSEEGNLFFSDDFLQKNKTAGVCLDTAHLERDRLVERAEYERKIGIIDKYIVGCNHVSAVSMQPRVERIDGKSKYDHHLYKNLEEFDYLRSYPKKYFSRYISLELENPLQELITAKKYVEAIIKQKENGVSKQ